MDQFNEQTTQETNNMVLTNYVNGEYQTTAGNTSSASGEQLTNRVNNDPGKSADKTVIGIFSSREAAGTAVEQLRQKGFSNEEINIVSKRGKEKNKEGGSGTYNDDITDGTLTGGTLGGLGGLLLGAGALAIPGLGPIVAAGPIAAAISGAVAGGLAGGLIDWGIPAEASQRYEQSVVNGNILAIVRTSSAKVGSAASIFRQNGAQNVESHDTVR